MIVKRLPAIENFGSMNVFCTDKTGTLTEGEVKIHSAVDVELERKLNMSLAELELSVRATNCLESEGIATVRDLVSRTEEELLEVRNFGETTLKEVTLKLGERAMHLGMKLPSLRRA